MLDAGLVQQLEELGWLVEFDNLVQDFENLKRTSDAPVGLLKKPRLCGAACRYIRHWCPFLAAICQMSDLHDTIYS